MTARSNIGKPRPGLEGEPHATLNDGARVAVVGGGPAGSFFCYFLLDMAERVSLDVQVDLYEPRDFWGGGPASCNMCGGIISETLVQNLALEGIDLPSTIVQRAIDSYVLHMAEGSVRIETPIDEMRIAAVYRAGGPRDVKGIEWGSFDGYLQMLAVKKGAYLRQERVEDIEIGTSRPSVTPKGGEAETYDLVVVAVGVNSTTLKQLGKSGLKYQPPETTKTFLREFHFPTEVMDRHLGSSMHIFLPDIPNLEFAAIIPKGIYASTCLLGEKIDNAMLKSFMDLPQVSDCMPPEWDKNTNSCQCAPKINVRGASKPFANRLVAIGDAGVTRLYKDGIGAAYRTAKSAAATVVFQGVEEDDFRRHYWPTCRVIEKDNSFGRFMFGVSDLIKRYSWARRAVLQMVSREQAKAGQNRQMSMVLWDLFTGSASYRDILMRTLRPSFVGRLCGHLVRSAIGRKSPALISVDEVEDADSRNVV